MSDIAVERSPDQREVSLLDERVRSELVCASGHGEEVELAAFVRENGEIRAGVYGWTWGGCCEVQSLWVDPRLRRSGLGSRLLDVAEREAMSRGCTQVVLFTHQLQEPGFYQRRGYEIVGRVPDYPAGTAALWFRKRLEPGWRSV